MAKTEVDPHLLHKSGLQVGETHHEVNHYHQQYFTTVESSLAGFPAKVRLKLEQATLEHQAHSVKLAESLQNHSTAMLTTATDFLKTDEENSTKITQSFDVIQSTTDTPSSGSIQPTVEVQW